MSNRDSLGFGDLLPQDVVNIFAQEKHSKRGRKKRSHSLGRALGWLKGKKRKGLSTNGQNLGLGPALDLALDGHPAGHQGGHKGGQKSGRPTHPHGNSHAAPKRDDDDKTLAPPLLQENVFIEASRPKYLEDLHTEALEGLKMLQQEENGNGVQFQDNESTISTMTAQTDGEGGGFMTDSTIADSTSVVSVQSSVSVRSSRSGLTRQGSTFRPLNSGKKSDKAKRRRQRKTVAGIPRHVQKELGLDRVGWTLAQKLDEEQFYNSETDVSPSTEDPQQRAQSKRGASASLQDIKVIHPLTKDKVEQLNVTHAGHRDDLALLQRLSPDVPAGDRPRSLAVPWMTTANSLQPKPPSPVMSMSPQAVYMSKVIPNAVLPPSIEVVEINRGRSRNSLRTVSKSSLVLSSPAPSRASSRASSSRTTSSRASTITSASRYNPPTLSDSSCWSNSESSETLVSDSSTISSNSTPRQKNSQDGDGKEDKVSIHSSVSKASKCTSNGRFIAKADSIQKEGQFVRSLSVMKPKRAPPPPSRSYSLHNKMKRRSRDLAEGTVISGEASLHRIPTEKNKSGSSPMPSKIMDSPGYNADTSSLDDSTGSASFSPLKSQALKAEETKVEEKVSREEKQESLQENKLSKEISPSSGYSSQDATSPHLSKQVHSSSPKHKRGIFAKLQKLFPASSSTSSTLSPLTQPEASENMKSTGDPKPDCKSDTVHVSTSVRTLKDLFNIPPHPKVHAPPPPPPEVWAHSKRSFELLLGPPAPDNVEAIIKKNPKDRRQQRQSPSASTEGSVKSKHKNPTITLESINGSQHVLDTSKAEESVILNAERENDERLAHGVDLKGNSKVTEKDEKVRVSDLLNGMLVKAVEKREGRLAAMKEDETKNMSMQATEVKSMDTSPAISIVRMSPSPSPILTHHPPQTIASPESSWPPPPPPITPVVSGSDELEFPLPPPPLFGTAGLVIPVQVPPEKKSIPGGDSSVVSVGKTECIKVTTETEPHKSSSSQRIAPPPLNIPPPPSYTAPPPPLELVTPPTMKKFGPPQKEVILPPPKEFSPPPHKEFTALPPKEDPPPPPKVGPPPPPKEFALPPPKVDPPPPPKELSSPPPKEDTPQPSKEDPPPSKELSPPPPKDNSPSPLREDPPPPPPEEDPSPSKEVSPAPPKEEFLPPPEEVSPPQLTEVSPAPPKESSPSLVEEAPPTLVQDVSPPLVNEVSTLPSKEIPAPSIEEVVVLSVEEDVSKLKPPESIPPPPPLLSPDVSEQDTAGPQEKILSEKETNPISLDSVHPPPQTIPVPPVPENQVVPLNTDGPAPQEAPPSPPCEVTMPPAAEKSPSPEKGEESASTTPVNIPLPLASSMQGFKQEQPSLASTETQNHEPTPANIAQEETAPIVTASLLQVVKLRSVNNSPEPPTAQEEPPTEVTMRKQQPSNQVPTTSTSGEAPQKPIRRSLIIMTTSPTSTSPPVTVASQPALPKSQTFVASSTSLSKVSSPTKKISPTMTASPSMNLQEAIRLRTAARSKEGSTSRLSIHSPTSPIDLHKSPSSTASFIFSKSNKRVVIENKPAPEANVQNNMEVSSVTKVVSEVESVKKGGKVPPPVAKKPKSKAKESETSEGTEQTAGQEAQQESIQDAAEKRNGTAGTVEGGETPST